MNDRETFDSRVGLLLTMIGTAVGLGNVWRFPYMVGKFGGASFVLFYICAVVLLGVPALMAEWTLGRHTRRGPAGAFERAGFPFGRPIGWFLFFVVSAATAYYTDAIGWVLLHLVAQIGAVFGSGFDASIILPPDEGFDGRSFGLQILCAIIVLILSALVLVRGVRRGIERASKILMPMLLFVLLILIARSLTLPGAWGGVEWYILKFDVNALTPAVMMAAIGQAAFSLSLGGTFMVVYGSYLDDDADLRSNAVFTAIGDLSAGLLAGLAILPAVIALGFEPASGPGLIFSTLPEVFATMPAGAVFGLLFYGGLFGAAFLSLIGAIEVMVAGLMDNLDWSRSRAVWTWVAVIFVLALPPMINMKIFVPWDLTFGSGMQTLGALFTLITVAYFLQRSEVLRQLGATEEGADPTLRALYLWLRLPAPAAILAVGGWWLVTDVFGWVSV